MNKKMVFGLAMLIIPWLTVPFIGKKAFFRFLPVSCFVNFILSITSVIANKKKWWVNKNPLWAGVPIDFSYYLGPYFIGTLWIFKLTYGNFPKYLLANIGINLINCFPFFSISEKVGMLKFKKMKQSTWFYMSVVLSILIYDIQNKVEQSIRKINS